MIYRCENQYQDTQDKGKYERCFLTGEICTFALHGTQHICEDSRPDKLEGLEQKAEGQLFVGSKL
jgi:hypothetical protein